MQKIDRSNLVLSQVSGGYTKTITDKNPTPATPATPAVVDTSYTVIVNGKIVAAN